MASRPLRAQLDQGRLLLRKDEAHGPGQDQIGRALPVQVDSPLGPRPPVEVDHHEFEAEHPVRSGSHVGHQQLPVPGELQSAGNPKSGVGQCPIGNQGAGLESKPVNGGLGLVGDEDLSPRAHGGCRQTPARQGQRFRCLEGARVDPGEQVDPVRGHSESGVVQDEDVSVAVPGNPLHPGEKLTVPVMTAAGLGVQSTSAAEVLLRIGLPQPPALGIGGLSGLAVVFRQTV